MQSKSTIVEGIGDETIYSLTCMLVVIVCVVYFWRAW